MKKIFSVLVFLIFCYNSFSQTTESGQVHPFSGKVVISGSGGVTFPFTDYSSIKPEIFGRGDLEYYFKLTDRHALGVRLSGGGGTLHANDPDKIPDEFKTSYYFFGGGVSYSYFVNERFMPFAFVGASYLWYNPKDINGNPLPNSTVNDGSLAALNYNGELGFHFNINKSLALNISGGISIHQNDLLDGFGSKASDSDMFITAGIGISYAFGKESDSDGDGIPDSRDQCPDTEAGIPVDDFGCPVDQDADGIPDKNDNCPDTPARVKVDKFGCPIDTDGDGIADYMDNCPDTPAGTDVDSFGCSGDSDNDGVPDDQDNCSNTPSGVKVDEKGCPEDKNKNGIPDYLEKEEKKVEPKVETPVYNTSQEKIVKNMIFTDGRLFVVQASAWKTRDKAESVAAQLKAKGYNSFVVEAYIEKYKRTWFRVRVGYYDTLTEAEAIAKQVR